MNDSRQSEIGPAQSDISKELRKKGDLMRRFSKHLPGGEYRSPKYELTDDLKKLHHDIDQIISNLKDLGFTEDTIKLIIVRAQEELAYARDAKNSLVLQATIDQLKPITQPLLNQGYTIERLSQIPPKAK